ncbi:tRNA (adenine(22)-N(1))-methyltransferase [Paraliobacillus ryukyuensis]|uniref:tRNA (adenine(22)-N(1))-methyltransferase n=1 Tax=Paraliobacillus ryukyuensis TaxID=200904 RepID=UPI0009A6E771|nr:tRNA (adenine(22)-N(1))-methyltransferase TrmK [Paraliobacillus ryukyuensis]
MNDKTLSKRLQLVAHYLPQHANFVDVGSDHAYLPSYVCSQDLQARAIAGEINEGPYLSAKQHVAAFGLTDQIEVIQGDGLSVIEGRLVDQVVIAGMGGTLIRSILQQGATKLFHVSRIIAQPNVDAPEVRQWFYQNNYQLVAEEIIKEDGHIYEILVADKGDPTTPYDKNQLERQLFFGPYLLQEKTAIFIEKWKAEKNKRERIVTQMHQAKVINYEKINMFLNEIKIIEEVLVRDEQSTR